MESMNRRSALAFGVSAAAAAPLFALTSAARAKEYGPTEGKELAPGVRLIVAGEGNSDIPAYKNVTIAHVVFQPGAVFPETVMDSDMVCYIATGEFKIKKADKEFVVKEGEFYTCTKGKTDGATNTSSVTALMEAAILKAA